MVKLHKNMFTTTAVNDCVSGTYFVYFHQNTFKADTEREKLEPEILPGSMRLLSGSNGRTGPITSANPKFRTCQFWVDSGSSTGLCLTSLAVEGCSCFDASFPSYLIKIVFTPSKNSRVLNGCMC